MGAHIPHNPHIQDFAGTLHVAKIFFNIDVVKAFHHIPIEPTDIPNTAIIKPFGLFEYLRTPFLLRNAKWTSQPSPNQVLLGLSFCFVYVDGILICSKRKEKHVEHLRQLLAPVDDLDAVLNPAKTDFAVPDRDGSWTP